MTLKTKIILFFVAIFIVATACLPYFYFYISTPQNHTYTGINYLLSEDNFVYYSYIEQIKQGEYFLTDLYTSEPTKPFLNIFWRTIGEIAKYFDLSVIIIYHLTRIVLIIIAVFLIYKLISIFLSQQKQRWFCFLFLMFTSGIGGIFLHFVKGKIHFDTGKFYSPIELVLTDSNIFLTFLQSPHVIASLIFILLVIILMHQALKNNCYLCSFVAGISGLILSQFHSYYFLLCNFVLLIFVMLDFFYLSKKLKINYILHCLIFFVISGLSIVYFVFQQNDLYAQFKYLQNVTLTPSNFFIIFNIISLIILTAIALEKRKNFNNLLLLAWIFSCLILIYSPIAFQSRFIKTMQIPIVILATQGFFYLKSKYFNWHPVVNYFLTFFIILIFSMSNTFVYIDSFIKTKQETLLYIPNQYMQAFDWLKKNLRQDDVTVAMDPQNILIPAFSGKKTFFAHPFETLNYQNKRLFIKIALKYLKHDPIIFHNLCQQHNITYLLQFNKKNKLEHDFLELQFENDMVQIYKIL